MSSEEYLYRVIWQEGQQSPPMTATDISNLVKTGRIAPGILVVNAQTNETLPAEMWPAIADRLAQGQTSPQSPTDAPAPMESFKMQKPQGNVWGGVIIFFLALSCVVGYILNSANNISPGSVSAMLPATEVKQPADVPAVPAAPPAPTYEVTDENWIEGKFGKQAFSGKVKNTSGQEIGYVEVNVEFLDESGSVIGTGRDNELNLRAGDEWRFEVLPPDGVTRSRARGQRVSIR
jgi:hypothetical protein